MPHTRPDFLAHLRGHSRPQFLFRPHQRQQYMLRLDRVGTELAGFVSCEEHGTSSHFREGSNIGDQKQERRLPNLSGAQSEQFYFCLVR
jgi:hypothetical protein